MGRALVDVPDAGTAAFGRAHDPAGEVGAIVMCSPDAPTTDTDRYSQW